MKKNINDIERVGRVAVGALLSSLAFWGPKKPWFLLSSALIADGIVGVCPLYLALGISTRNEDKDGQQYFVRQSSSEIAAGHPIVGVS